MTDRKDWMLQLFTHGPQIVPLVKLASSGVDLDNDNKINSVMIVHFQHCDVMILMRS